MKEDIKFPNPLDSKQRKLLFELSGFAKEQCFLEGNQRKTLFSCGKYDQWFDTSFDNLIKALNDLLEECPEDKNLYKAQIQEVIKQVETVDTSYGGYLYTKLQSGKASPQEVLMCAEHLENQGNVNEALRIANILIEKFPDNRTIEKMINRLRKFDK